ncbi:MAG TPA: AraC family transcriptional regulator [Chitinophagaceae bacterium]|jgi:AraC-like DNA-binding protein|nr:AraC family transcriptional regulator [Chitinophagaceae bacterium]
MSYPDWINEEGIPYVFTPYDVYKYRGNLLSGSIVTQFKTRRTEILQQEWVRGLYRLSYRSIQSLQKFLVEVIEPGEMMRLEAVIDGELNTVPSNGQPVRLRQGHYQFTKVRQFKSSFPKDKGCAYFVSYYSTALLQDLGITDHDLHCSPRPMPERMLHIIHEALHHPHSGSVTDIYYRKLVTELVFIHLTSELIILPAELSEKDIAAIYQADAILAKDLSEHYSIPQLSGMAGTNAFKLKRGFRLVFKMGVFARLLFRRMEHAKMLLATTPKPIKEVAYESGYSTVGGFINAFRKRFGSTPLDWREANNKSGSGNNSVQREM